MLVKARVSFAGSITMHAGETRDIPEEVATDLLAAGYVVKAKSTKKAAKNDDTDTGDT